MLLLELVCLQCCIYAIEWFFALYGCLCFYMDCCPWVCFVACYLWLVVCWIMIKRCSWSISCPCLYQLLWPWNLISITCQNTNIKSAIKNSLTNTSKYLGPWDHFRIMRVPQNCITKKAWKRNQFKVHE